MSFGYARGGRAPAGLRAVALCGLVLLGLAVPLAAKAADLVATAAEDGRFKTFVQALKASDAADVLGGEKGPFTVLAPTDKAFAKLPEALLDNLMLPANEAALERVLGLHIVRGTAYAANNLPVNLETIGGERLAVTFTDGALTVRQAAPEDAGEPSPTIESREGNEARIAFGDVEADNGVIHGLDTVLLPVDLGPLETTDVAKAEDGRAGAAEDGENEGSSPTAAEAEPPPSEPAANDADVTVTTYPSGDEGENESDGAASGLTPVPDANVTVETISPADADAETETTADQAGTATPEDDQASPPEPAEAAGTPVPDANVTVTTVSPDATMPPDDAGADNDRTGTADNQAPTPEPSRADTPPPEEDATAATAAPAPAAGEDAADEGAENPAAGAAVDLTSPLVPVSELIGRTVRGEDGEDLGEVEDVLISLQTARVERFVLEVDRSLFNLSGRSVNVDVDEVSVDPVDGAVVVDPAVVAK